MQPCFLHLLAMFSRSLDQEFARFRPIFPDEMMNQDHRQLNVQFLWIKIGNVMKNLGTYCHWYLHDAAPFLFMM